MLLRIIAVFEAVVLGGHRIDLTRKVNGTLSICEATAILLLLHFGFGLIAMTLVMGASELVYAYCCYRASIGLCRRLTSA